MKITIFIPTNIGINPHLRERKIECVGTGTEDDPVIIEQSEKLPLSFVVRNSSLFIEIRNVNIYYISLRTSRNILVKDCKLTRSELGHCSKIEYRNTVVSKSMSIYTTNNIQIKDCTIGKLKLNRSNSNIIKNCSIAKIKTTISKDNVFESILTPEAEFSKLRKTRFVDLADRLKLKSLVVSVIIFLLIVIFLPIIAFGTFIDLPFFFFLLGFFIFLFYFGNFVRSRARKQIKYEKD